MNGSGLLWTTIDPFRRIISFLVTVLSKRELRRHVPRHPRDFLPITKLSSSDIARLFGAFTTLSHWQVERYSYSFFIN
jgi:hypothetical protein